MDVAWTNTRTPMNACGADATFNHSITCAHSPHEEACRVVAFHPEGGAVYTGASDKYVERRALIFGWAA